MASDAGEATAFVRGAMPLCDHLGVEAVRLDPDEVVLELPWRPELCTAGGVLHGGALLTLADAAGATLAYLRLPDGAAGTTTVATSSNLVGAVREGRARATARVVHAGATTCVVEVTTTDDAGRPIARTLQTQLVLRR